MTETTAHLAEQIPLPPTRVFISHSSVDNPFAERLAADLRSAGVDVWLDQKEITYDDYVTRINQGLKGRQWLILIMTPAALHSQ